MDSRIGYRRPLRTAALLRKKRVRARLCIGAALAIAAITAACTWEPGTWGDAGKVAAAAPVMQVAQNSVLPVTMTAARPVYPYSIVPGGVATRDDIVRRVRTDAVVARHYASFEIDKAHPVKVDKARAVHVSYRKGDKVYWTAKTVMLTPGEVLLTDGTSDIRGRCGNRISTAAMLPVAINEPTPAELDQAMAGGGLENASFAVDDVVPAGSNAYAFTQFPGFVQPAAGPSDAGQPSGMPSVPFSAPNGSGLVPTSYLTVSSPPGGTVAIPAGPDLVTTPATPVDPVATTPEAPVPPATPATPTTPVIPVTPVHVDTPVTPDAPVVPVPPTPTADPAPPVIPTDIPEPGTPWLMGAALVLLYLIRNKPSLASRQNR